jgi:ribosomal protein S27AE
MGMFWNADMPQASNFTGNPGGDDRRQQIRELEHQVARLQLMNQALWELIRERTQLTDADLERKAQEVDLRDGVADGKITNTALKCPTCGRVSSSKHWKCLYCGLEFQKPVMG